MATIVSRLVILLVSYGQQPTPFAVWVHSSLTIRPYYDRMIMPNGQPRRKVTYGRKVAVGRLETFIDLSPVASSKGPRSLARDSPSANNALIVASKSSTVAASRRALEDVTAVLANLQINEYPLCRELKHDKYVLCTPTRQKGLKLADDFSESRPCHPWEAWLQPLVSAYESVGPEKLVIRPWNVAIEDGWTVEKIAESSFAEVYKVSNVQGVSVLKIMALKPPRGPGSESDSAVQVEDVISEVVIMNMLADRIGFLEFKAAHVIEGTPPKALQLGYDRYAQSAKTYFPEPMSYQKSQLFLVLELGDAGSDLEQFHAKTSLELWDIFLSTIITLAGGEQAFKFEHRDLHEGNICVKQVRERKSWSRNSSHRYGYSGLEVTILDYTLSRAERNGVVTYRDLEQEDALFEADDNLQQQIYLRMRNWCYFGDHGHDQQKYLKAKDLKPNAWKKFMPYTNVLWLYFILEFILAKFEGPKPQKNSFCKQVADIRKRLDPDKPAVDGGFQSVMEVRNYAISQGWIEKADIMANVFSG